MNKVCVVIAEKTEKDLLNKLHQLETEHDFFELRFDKIQDLNKETIENVLKSKKSRVIATIRTVDEDGEFEGNADEYSELINACYSSDADFIDIELAQIENNEKLTIKDETRTIISYHDFDSTPDDNELNEIIKRMNDISENSITKIACMTNEMNDAVRLTSLLRSQPTGKSIVIAMGEMGQILRLLAPSLGAFTTFASAETTPVAPGQLYYKTMNKLLDAMEITDGRQ